MFDERWADGWFRAIDGKCVDNAKHICGFAVDPFLVQLPLPIPLMQSVLENLDIGSARVRVGVMPMAEIDERLISDWLDLEGRVVEGNAFLSPHFVLPAAQFLDPNKQILVLTIFRMQAEGHRLIGLGVFIARLPRLRFPLPHLQAYRSPHSFLSGMLLDRDDALLALEGLGLFLSSSRVPWCGAEFMGRVADAAMDRIQLVAGVPARVRWSEYYRTRRAILVPSKGLQTYDSVIADGDLGRELRRKRRRLEEQGTVEWRLLVGKEVSTESIETFLRLEDQGWKHQSRKSMLMRPGHADFFREMTRHFRDDGRTFFTELLLDGRVIASTSNFISGDAGFAFKIGWDTGLAPVSPGLLNELELLRCNDQRFSSLAFIDSGAEEGSYIEKFWRDSRSVTSGTFMAGRLASCIAPTLRLARSLKRGLLSNPTA